MSKPGLFILSAPSGCGKGELIKALKKEFDIFVSVSCTTRGAREGEIDGVHYNFISKERFESLAADDGFLEHACFSGNSYGTPKAPVEESMSQGKDVMLEIEPQGAFQVKEKRPDAVSVFVLPPSFKELDRRLHKRALQSGETEAQIQKRLATAEGDIRRAYEYDYVVMNDALEDAIADLTKIMKTVKEGGGDLQEFTAANRKNMIDEVLKNA